MSSVRMSSNPLLSAEEITAGYGSVPIVQDVSVCAEAGQIVAILGPNGAGKSTLLKAIFGYLKPRSGRVLPRGAEVTGMAPEALVGRGISYVPQVGNIFPTLTVRENLEMGGYARRTGLRERLDAVLAMFPDLGKALERRAATLSGGQRSMLAMGRGLMLDPAVLLLDEPTAGLAPEYAREVWSQVQRVAASGTAVVVVEQNAAAALQAADWAYVLVGVVTAMPIGLPRCSTTRTWAACFSAANTQRYGSLDAPTNRPRRARTCVRIQ